MGLSRRPSRLLPCFLLRGPPIPHPFPSSPHQPQHPGRLPNGTQWSPCHSRSLGERADPIAAVRCYRHSPPRRNSPASLVCRNSSPGTVLDFAVHEAFFTGARADWEPDSRSPGLHPPGAGVEYVPRSSPRFPHPILTANFLNTQAMTFPPPTNSPKNQNKKAELWILPSLPYLRTTGRSMDSENIYSSFCCETRGRSRVRPHIQHGPHASKPTECQ